MAELIKDNEVVYNKYIADDKFTYKAIRNLIHLYNTGLLDATGVKGKAFDAIDNWNDNRQSQNAINSFKVN